MIQFKVCMIGLLRQKEEVKRQCKSIFDEPKKLSNSFMKKRKVYMKI
jgi:hypothetical protein